MGVIWGMDMMFLTARRRRCIGSRCWRAVISSPMQTWNTSISRKSTTRLVHPHTHTWDLSIHTPTRGIGSTNRSFMDCGTSICSTATPHLSTWSSSGSTLTTSSPRALFGSIYLGDDDMWSCRPSPNAAYFFSSRFESLERLSVEMVVQVTALGKVVVEKTMVRLQNICAPSRYFLYLFRTKWACGGVDESNPMAEGCRSTMAAKIMVGKYICSIKCRCVRICLPF